jgi:septal ring factor EnvC (AmiA/AmiB activator)
MARSGEDSTPTVGNDRVRQLATELSSVMNAMVAAQTSLIADVQSAIGSSEEHILKVGTEMAHIYDAIKQHTSDIESLRHQMGDQEATGIRSEMLATLARVLSGGESIGKAANLALTHLQFQDRMRQCLDYVVRHLGVNVRIVQALMDGLARCDGAASDAEITTLFDAARAPELEPDKHKPHQEPAGTGEVEFF